MVILGTSLESPDSVEADDEEDDILEEDEVDDEVRWGGVNSSSSLFALRNHTLVKQSLTIIGSLQGCLGLLETPQNGLFTLNMWKMVNLLLLTCRFNLLPI